MDNINTAKSEKTDVTSVDITKNNNTISDDKPNKLISVDGIVGSNISDVSENVSEKKNSISDNSQSKTSTKSQQIKKDDDNKKDTIDNDDDLLYIINKNPETLAQKNIRERIMFAVLTFGESEKYRKMTATQKIWYKIKPFFLFILSFITFGIYKKKEQQYNMRLAYELNERVRKTINNIND